ncbi:hypothetical protein [Rubinisphaera sp. JC750]|uniref:hypothetical protein n=1 Tax=Rubinisphaera sp. JC750 TaxID=2898658 RepID=UPI001F179956|nr:hypothetical protein [Rubinisphaera sp. JC750]
MKKTHAIRIVAKEDISQTNQQIKDAVFAKYGLAVQTNEIINTLGAYEKRRDAAGFSPLLIQRAKQFLRLVGDFRLSKTLLLIAHQQESSQ